MRWIISFLVMMSLPVLLFSIDIQYRDSAEQDRLNPVNVSGLEYYSLDELRQTLKAGHQIIDYENNKLNFSIFDESIILYLNTHYASSNGNLINLSYPIIHRDGDFLLPETFFTRAMPEFFPTKFSSDTPGAAVIAQKPEDKKVKTIVLDPGHGGKDPGAVGKRAHEKNIVLSIAQKIKQALERELDVNVLLTRSTDEFVLLQDRTKFANQHNADLFISLHCNGVKQKSAHGIEVYILSTASTDDERALEALENSVVLDYEGGREAVQAYDDLAFILADLQQSEQLEESSDLAIRLQRELIAQTGAADRGVKQAGLYVLRGAFMPSVLIEFGFITNEAEEQRLLNNAHQNKLVTAVVNGVRSFKMKYDSLW